MSRLFGSVHWAMTLALLLPMACGGQVNEDPDPGASGGTAVGGGGAGTANGSPGGGASSGTGGVSAASCKAGAPIAPTRVWLLSDRQYSRTVRDLLGVTIPAQITGGQQDHLTRFADLARVSGQSASQLSDAATRVSSLAVANMNALVSCPGAQRNEACAVDFIRTKVSRLWRRPLEPLEVQELTAVFREGMMDSFDEGLRLVIEAALQAPSFLYRTELGPAGAKPGAVALTPYETASALSYFLLDAPPDAMLWSRASDGTLAQPAVLAAEVDRLLALPAARDTLNDIAAEWLDLDKLAGAQKDPQIREFTPALKQSLDTSARKLIADALWSGKINDLVTTRRMYVDRDMASVYKVPGFTGTAMVPIDLPAAERGAGVASHPAWMTAEAKNATTSIIHRGLFVHYELICADAVPPPPDTVATAAAANGALDERQAAAERAANGACSGCHARFDPFGLVLENYDTIGRYRTTLNGRPIDATATVSNFGSAIDGTINGALDLGTRIAASGRLNTCAVKKFGQVAFGRELDAAAQCALAAVSGKVQMTGSFAELVRGLLTNPSFVQRQL